LDSKTRQAETDGKPLKTQLLLTRYNPERVKRGEMLSVDDVLELLGIPFLGVIPESQSVLNASNSGMPVVLDESSDAAQAYLDVVYRFLGQDRPHRFVDLPKRGIFKRMFG